MTIPSVQPTISRLVPGKLGVLALFCACLAAAGAPLPTAAQDTARDVIGRNVIITNPQIRRDLHFQRSPGLRAQSFKESGGFAARGARPSAGRLTELPRGGFAAPTGGRLRGTDDPSLPGNEPTPEERAARRDVFKGVDFSRPGSDSWLKTTSQPPGRGG